MNHIPQGTTVSVAALAGLGKFNGDPVRWNEAKNSLYCKLAQDDLDLYIETRLDVLMVKPEHKADVATTTARAAKAWVNIMSQLTGTALIFAQQQPRKDAFALWKALCNRYEGSNLDLVHTAKLEIDRTSLRIGE